MSEIEKKYPLLNEVKRKKENLDTAIFKLIKEFEKETELSVNEVTIGHVKEVDIKQKQIYFVRTEVTL